MTSLQFRGEARRFLADFDLDGFLLFGELIKLQSDPEIAQGNKALATEVRVGRVAIPQLNQAFQIASSPNLANGTKQEAATVVIVVVGRIVFTLLFQPIHQPPQILWLWANLTGIEGEKVRTQGIQKVLTLPLKNIRGRTTLLESALAGQ
jgi:hypothetical protein